MILVFHHCGQFIISIMEFLFSWVTNLYICIDQLENTPIKSNGHIWYKLAVILKPSSVPSLALTSYVGGAFAENLP